MKTKELQSRDKILRDALESAQMVIDDARDYHTSESREILLLSEIEKINLALKKSDAIKEGPSERDRFTFDILSEAIEKGIIKGSLEDMKWLISKLKQAWDM